MTRLAQISLFRFKNHADAVFRFPARVTGITGKNGCGKTNLLDAIYYLCFARSYFSYTDASLVRFGEQGFRLTGSFIQENNAETPVSCILRENGAKELKVGDEACKKLSAFIGRFGCVMIAPDDIEIINSTGSTQRRRMLDAILCQTDSQYLTALQKYNKILQQRNSLLRGYNEHPDDALLDIYDHQLADTGNYIFEARKKCCLTLQPMLLQHYRELAGNTLDGIETEYKSQLQTGNTYSLLKQYRQRDIAAQRTNCGIHKDDLELRMQGAPLRNAASQGQKKSLLLALKLSEFQLLKEHSGSAPLLLLDDMFERLDPERIARLLQLVTGPGGPQVFITDTNQEQLVRYLEQFNADYSIIRLGENSA